MYPLMSASATYGYGALLQPPTKYDVVIPPYNFGGTVQQPQSQYAGAFP